jgi:hypothetical protein
VQVKAANAGALPRYFGFGRGLSVLTSVTDHYATFGTKVIPTKVREGLYALDEIFALRERDSELTITEHTSDTAGFTDLLFGAYDIVGLGFCPRIRDLADQRLWLPPGITPPPLVAPLVANRVPGGPILGCWDDLLRLGASIHEGTVLPSLLLAKLQAFPRQNALARAMQEYGRLAKTLFILRYLQRPDMRKRVGRQLKRVKASTACARRCTSPTSATSATASSSTRPPRPCASPWSSTALPPTTPDSCTPPYTSSGRPAFRSTTPIFPTPDPLCPSTSWSTAATATTSTAHPSSSGQHRHLSVTRHRARPAPHQSRSNKHDPRTMAHCPR